MDEVDLVEIDRELDVGRFDRLFDHRAAARAEASAQEPPLGAIEHDLSPRQARLDRHVAPVDAADGAADVGRPRHARDQGRAPRAVHLDLEVGVAVELERRGRQQVERQVAVGAEVELAIASQRDGPGDQQRRRIAVQSQRLDAQAFAIAGDGERIGGDGPVAVARLEAFDLAARVDRVGLGDESVDGDPSRQHGIGEAQRKVGEQAGHGVGRHRAQIEIGLDRERALELESGGEKGSGLTRSRLDLEVAAAVGGEQRFDVGQRPVRNRDLVEREARLAARRACRPFDGGLDVDRAGDVGPGGARGQEARERQIVDTEAAGDLRGSPIVSAGAVDRAAVEDAAQLFDHHAPFLFARAESQQAGGGAGDVALARPQRRHLAGERPARLIDRASRARPPR